MTTGADSSVRWTLVSSPTMQRLSSIKMTGVTTGVALGDRGTYLVYGGGTVWSPVNFGPTQRAKNFYGIEADASGSVWLAGDSGTIVYAPSYGGGFAQQASNVLVTLASISRVEGTSEMFAAGAGGVIIHTLDGVGFSGTWSGQASQTTHSLFFIGGPADTNMLAVGEAGSAVRFNGTAWSPDTLGVSVNIRSGAFVGNPSTDTWLVGDRGTILHSVSGVSGTWSVQPSGTTEDLFGITADSATRAFAVGSGGTILHWDGATWRAMVSPTFENLRAIAHGYSASVDYWVVGDCGTILHGTT
ncbi:MAG: hypothetical protein ACM37V_08380 [Gemmatimonadota bacterium]